MRLGSVRPLQRLAYVRRIEALELALEQAQHLLYQDELTPLLNRRGFRRTCDQWPASRPMETRMCCVMVDLDDFKSVNDQYGHPVGDAALLHFSKTLLQHLRHADVLARLGGDEFALVLVNTLSTDALRVLEHLQRVLAASPLTIHGTSVRLRFSAGVADRQVHESLPDALARADAALLDAKRSGKALVRMHMAPENPGG
jgi:diguanylate cyclase (GGDEF)-like protein